MFRKFYLQVKVNGVSWAILYSFRFFIVKIANIVEAVILKIERRKRIFGESALTSRLNTVRANFIKWNDVPWQTVGDQWTTDVFNFKSLDPVEWKKKIIDEFMYKYMGKQSHVLEVGPGGGRWTEILLKSSAILNIADISETSIETCRKLFKGHSNINYHLIVPSLERFIPETFVSKNSIDFIWSYDVFVHINPKDISEYIKEFSEILKPGGVAVIHHAGNYKSESHRLHWFRSNLDEKVFNYFLKENQLKLIHQDFKNAHFPGDIISVFKK
jgi:SAM-dependent methyltransferase